MARPIVIFHRQEAHKYDVFISHGDSDLKRALEILHILEKHQLSCFFGERDIMPGTIRSDAIADAVRSSRRVVLLLSRDFLETGW